MKRLLTAMWICCVAAVCSAADRAAEVDDIREATFRYLFEHNASGLQQNAEVYFLSVVNTEAKRPEDPSDAFMKRFADHNPRVARRSESSSSIDVGVQDKKTGESGLIFNVGEIRWISETEVEVDGGYYEAGLSSSGNTYFLKKRDGKWVVYRNVMHWISLNAPRPVGTTTRERTRIALATAYALKWV